MPYEQQQQLIDAVTAQMQICADMLGPRDENKQAQYGFVPGLNENELAKSLRTRIDSIRNGIFQVMFTGCFNSGKSTLINALIRRDALKTGSTPETAVITKIFFNADEEKVVIYKRNEAAADGKLSTEEIYDLEEFFSEYRIDENDREKFLRTINHVEIFLRNNGVAGSVVQFVDSPGTQASAADNKISLSFVKHADAIVFLISAVAPMDQYDTDFIAENFAGNRMKNVFFVVNRYNQLNTDEDRQRVKDRVRDELRKVFLDEHGNFNQKLYERRVFYVNAYGSMNTRLGRETPFGPMYSRMILDEETGVPQFEQVLGEFLTSGDKDKIALSAYRPQMASLFVAAEKAVKGKILAVNNGIQENQAVLTAYENDRAEIEREINGIRQAINETEQAILYSARDAYDKFLRDIDENWGTYFADPAKTDNMQISFVAIAAAYAVRMLAFWRDADMRQLQLDESVRKQTQGFADGIKVFLEKRAEDLSNLMAFQIQNNIAQLMEKLKERQKHLEQLNMPINVNEIVEKITLEKNIPIKGDANQPKLGQAFVAILFADPELINMAGAGGTGTMDFIVQVVKVNTIDIILTGVLVAIIGNIFGIIAFVIYKIIRYFNSQNQTTQALIAEMKKTILDGYKDEHGDLLLDQDDKPIFTGLRGGYRAEYINKVSATIHGVMQRAGGQLVDGINKSLADVEENLVKINNLLENDAQTLRRETVRLNKNLNALANAICEISLLTDGTSLDRNQIRSMAVNAN